MADNYKDIIERSHEQFLITSSALDTSKKMLESIEGQYENNMKINKDVKKMVQALKDKGIALNQYLDSFSEMSKNAKDVFPILEKNINDITGNLSDIVEKSVGQVNESFKNTNEAMLNSSKNSIKL